MQHELDFFMIDDVYCGGDQNWSPHWLMRLGGCSTVTACELSLCLARSYPSLAALYPFNADNVTRAEFVQFMDIMFPYVHPGIRGLTDIAKYARGLCAYAQSVGCSIATQLLHGDSEFAEAVRFISESIDRGHPVAYLMLNHCNPAFEDFFWHWFTVVGYKDTDEGMSISAVTYGKQYTLQLADAWETGHRWKGGLVTALPQSMETST